MKSSAGFFKKDFIFGISDYDVFVKLTPFYNHRIKIITDYNYLYHTNNILLGLNPILNSS